MSEMRRPDPDEFFEQIRFRKSMSGGRPPPKTDCSPLPPRAPETYRETPSPDAGPCTMAPLVWVHQSLHRPVRKVTLWERLLRRHFCRALPKTCHHIPRVQSMSTIGTCGWEWPARPNPCKKNHA